MQKTLLLILLSLIIQINSPAQELMDNILMGMDQESLQERSRFHQLWKSKTFKHDLYGIYTEYEGNHKFNGIQYRGVFHIHEDFGLFEMELSITGDSEKIEEFDSVLSEIDRAFPGINVPGVMTYNHNGLTVKTQGVSRWKINMLFSLDLDEKIQVLKAANQLDIIGINSFDIESIHKTDLIDIPEGRFKQYEDDGRSYFEHSISSFYMGKYEVTKELWFRVYEWAVNNGYDEFGYIVSDTIIKGKIGVITDPGESRYYPVSDIDWYSGIVWCNAYSEMSGLEPCYLYQSQVIRSVTGLRENRDLKIQCNWEANGYRYPTEGEWQYAAGYSDGSEWLKFNYPSGGKTFFNDKHDGNSNKQEDGREELLKTAWYDDPYGPVSHEVGLKEPNSLGLYDMSGNVWEWCWDVYSVYPETASRDYRGPDGTSSSGRVLRGGCSNNKYSDRTSYAAISYRGRALAMFNQFKSTGFRIAKNKL